MHQSSSRTNASALLVLFALSLVAQAQKPISIGTRRELFVDNHLIDELIGAAAIRLHRPTAEEVVLTTDKPWEGNTSAYYTIFQDGDLFRMYYRGSHYDEKTKKATHPEVTCYAESKDGIHWTKPALGLFDFNGSKENNIVWKGMGTHCFTPFKDDNPDCKADERYKALSAGSPRGLYSYTSADGIRWKQSSKKPVITKGAFDSQNLAFWDSNRKLYVAYFRFFNNGVRDIRTSTSKDFVTWSGPEDLKYPGARKEHLYTNAIRLYERAPHYYMGFPTRYLPNQGQRVEPIFMTSRDGTSFLRWPDALIPEDAPKDRGGNRSNYMTRGLLILPKDKKNISLYATEAYYTGPDSRVRRFTIRLDGFVSIHAGARSGEIITKPLVFSGNKLELNYHARKGGTVQVEFQEPGGEPYEGFSLADSEKLDGNVIDRVVKWNNKTDLSKLIGKPVRIRIVLKNADVFAFRTSK